ncbi:MAG TPA: hypothetical protein ENJ42_09260 [Hellea balneolensis]|uniref:Band 7 domain-containing protein n=1 Tax=Hellea balneolensis TaxID=287478 RepID=A0A7C5LUJ2_9PROT|nr:hypothetical protein [Hellea balneolensis]
MVVITLANAVKVVPEGMSYTVERHGKYIRTLLPGQHWIIPFIDKIGFRINMRERKLRVPFSELKTKDNHEVYTDADILVRVKSPHIVAYETGNVDETIKLNIRKFMKSVVKSRTLSEILSHADEIDEELLSKMRAEQDKWGVDISFVDVHRFQAV